MKRIVIAVLICAMVILPACGGSVPQAKAEPTADPLAELKEAKAQVDPKNYVSIDGNTITVRDDGTGENTSGDEMQKSVILTTRNIGYKGETGPFTFEVQSIQVAEITAQGSTASVLGIEPGKKATLIGIQMAVENTSNEDLSWHPNQSTIITNDKEQVDADIFLSDSVGGDFLGNVVKKGQVYFICKDTNAENLTHAQLRINGPFDKHFDRVGDDVTIEFDFPKD